MTAGIALLRETLWHPGASGHVLRTARWVRPSDGLRYWHIPRSGADHGMGVLSLQFWCGQQRWVATEDLTNAEPHENRCATCEGRALGYEQRNGLIFRPRSAFDLPRMCPAFCRGNARCLFCGSKGRYGRGYNADAEYQHRAGPDLANYAPCPHHGWREVSEARDGAKRLICTLWLGGIEGHCNNTLQPLV